MELIELMVEILSGQHFLDFLVNGSLVDFVDVYLLIRGCRTRDVSHTQVFDSLDRPRNHSTNSVPNTSLRVVLFNEKDVSSTFFNVLFETFDVQRLQTENVQNSNSNTFLGKLGPGLDCFLSGNCNCDDNQFIIGRRFDNLS